MVSLVLTNARLFDRPCRTADLVIEGAFIVSRGPADGTAPERVVDLSDKVVLPAFVDAHTHLDKALTADLIPNETGTLQEAVQGYVEHFATVTEQDVYDRAARAIAMAISHGTGTLRSHVELICARGLAFIDPILQLRREVQDRITVQVVAAPFEHEDRPQMLRLLERALAAGADVVGGYPTQEADPRSLIDDMFTLAKAAGVPLDFHVDESDEPVVADLEYLADKTIAEGYQGKVTAGHCSSLALVPQDVADRVIRKVAEARLNVVTLPSCNLFLMGRSGAHPHTRGITRVRELRRAGVRVAFASDNVRDPFRPFGNADMLEEALLAAQVTQMGYPRDLLEVLEMGTYDPAAIAGLAHYGLAPGDYADLVVLDASDPVEALLSRARVEFVLHRGRLVWGRFPAS